MMKIKRYIREDGVICVRGYDHNHTYELAEVGIDGNCGYALLGPNIQEGECEFVEIERHPYGNVLVAERNAWCRALCLLRERLCGHINYYIKS